MGEVSETQRTPFNGQELQRNPTRATERSDYVSPARQLFACHHGLQVVPNIPQQPGDAPIVPLDASEKNYRAIKADISGLFADRGGVWCNA
ncbi:hypothetical protein [Mesorhizobium sp. LSHC412B00]|uniref:hypothetical protein n=1 Tax=Mesorhizobium sp. LSHC412B00 TaxID=1287285 RepID=UPI0012EBE1F7|nr:hypothetical protein [Mesorhizobium sp. LSHC412B00]